MKQLALYILSALCLLQAVILITDAISSHKQAAEFQSRKECREKRFAYQQAHHLNDLP